MNNYEQEIMTFRKVLQEYPKQFQDNKEELQRLREEEIDLHHLIEMVDMNAREGFYIYKQLQNNRLNRRKIKDENAFLEPVVNMIDKKQFHKVNDVIGDIRKTKNAHKNRKYRMKVRTDLQDLMDRRGKNFYEREISQY